MSKHKQYIAKCTKCEKIIIDMTDLFISSETIQSLGKDIIIQKIYCKECKSTVNLTFFKI